MSIVLTYIISCTYQGENFLPNYEKVVICDQGFKNESYVVREGQHSDNSVDGNEILMVTEKHTYVPEFPELIIIYLLSKITVLF